MHLTLSSEGGRPIVVRSWLVIFASIIHFQWGVLLIISPKVMDVAPISELAKWMGYNQYLSAAVYLLAAACAWWGVARHKADLMALVMGIPQVIVLFMGLSISIEVVMSGEHPDGTIDGHPFFLAQLANSIWLPPLYIISMYSPYWKVLWQSYRRKK